MSVLLRALQPWGCLLPIYYMQSGRGGSDDVDAKVNAKDDVIIASYAWTASYMFAKPSTHTLCHMVF